MRFPLRKAIPAAVHLGAAAVLPHFSSFGVGPAPARIERTAAEYVDAAHEAGLEVATWAPSPEEAEPLVEAGVDCLIVDHADERTWAPRRRLLHVARGARRNPVTNSPTCLREARSNPRKPPRESATRAAASSALGREGEPQRGPGARCRPAHVASRRRGFRRLPG